MFALSDKIREGFSFLAKSANFDRLIFWGGGAFAGHLRLVKRSMWMGLGLGIGSRLRRIIKPIQMNVKSSFRPRVIFRGKLEDIGVVFSEPHDMAMGDRIVLYGLIRGLHPKSYLEIGVRWGGSARIVATAMEANGFGSAVGLDPSIEAFRPTRSELHGRYVLCKGFSPEDTGAAAAMLPEPVDFGFIDAVHTYSAVKVDLNGLMPHLASEAHILFHDAFHQGINEAIDEFLKHHPEFEDLGIISRNCRVGSPVSYMGLRLIRRGKSDFLTEISKAHREAGFSAPTLDASLWDYDPYANRIGNPLGRRDQ